MTDNASNIGFPSWESDPAPIVGTENTFSQNDGILISVVPADCEIIQDAMDDEGYLKFEFVYLILT